MVMRGYPILLILHVLVSILMSNGRKNKLLKNVEAHSTGHYLFKNDQCP
jgi:hypothetical protein